MNQQTFSNSIEKFHLLKHPFYQAWMRGSLSQETLKDYACQYYTHVSAFPRYISAVHSQCESEANRQILLENLNDEEGLSHGVSHPELWLRFAEGLGIERKQVQLTNPRPAVKKVVSTFFELARSSFHEGLGSLFAYESQVPEIADSKIVGLKVHYHIDEPRTLEFFEIHKSADVYHRQAMEQILATLPEKEMQKALLAAKTTAEVLWDFLTDVQNGASNASLQ